MISFPKTILVVTILFIFFTFVPNIRAADFETTCGPNGCSDIDPIFNEIGIYPGLSLSKTLKVNNNYSEERSFAIEIQNFSDSSPSMGDVLKVSIADDGNGAILYGPVTITNWNQSGFLHLGSISSGSSKTYKFNVGFDDKGNEYQNKKLTFDLKMGFDELNVLAAQTVATGGGWPLKTRVLGVESSQEASPTPEVLAEDACSSNPTLWWLVLLIETLLMLICAKILVRRKLALSRKIAALAVIATISQIIHEKMGCSCADSFLCSKYLWLNILIFLAGILVTSRKTSKRRYLPIARM